MKVTEPLARTSVGAVVPQQPGVVDPVDVDPVVGPVVGPVVDPVMVGSALAEPELAEPAPPVVIDHVRAHDVSCYWNHLECRWQCAT
jgi:hypothetical protein